MKNKYLLLIFLSVLITLGGYFTWKNLTNEEIKLNIGIIKVQSGLPTFVAFENDIFLENGIEPNLISYKTSDQTFDALKNGEIDVVGVSGIAQGLQLNDIYPNTFKIIGVLHSSPCLIVNNTSKIKTLEDLQGKSIGVFPGSMFGKYVKETLIRAGVNTSQITLVPLPPPLQLNELKNNGIDALFSLEPIGKQGVSTSTCRYLSNENLFSKYLLDEKPFPGGIVAVSERLIKEAPETVPKILESYNQSMKLIINEKFNAVPYLDKYTSIDASILNSITYDGAIFDNYAIAENLKSFESQVNSWGLFNKQVVIKDLIYE